MKANAAGLAFSQTAANNCQPIMPMTTVFKSAFAENES
jgi:hypothetical protein